MLFAFLTSHADPAQPVGFEETVCHQHSIADSTVQRVCTSVSGSKQNPASTEMAMLSVDDGEQFPAHADVSVHVSPDCLFGRSSASPPIL